MFALAAPLSAVLEPIGAFIDILVIGFATGIAYEALGERVTGHSLTGVRLLVVLVARLLTRVLIIGFVLLVFPGLYAVAKLYLTIPAVMADSAGPVEALSVSASTTDGHVWTVFGYTVLVGVLSGGVSIPSS